MQQTKWRDCQEVIPESLSQKIALGGRGLVSWESKKRGCEESRCLHKSKMSGPEWFSGLGLSVGSILIISTSAWPANQRNDSRCKDRLT
jgi:hypothetical protein